MATAAAGNLVFVNTRFSCLSELDTVDSFRVLWKPPFISEVAPEFRCHLNGMCMDDGKPRFVTAISTADVPDGWRGERAETGVLVDVRADAVVMDALSMPHSPRIQNGSLWILESGRGYLIKVDLKTFRREDVVFSPGFLRGMSLVRNYAVVGISKGRETGFDGLAVGQSLEAIGLEPQCGVQIVDTERGVVAEWITFEGGIREIFAVELIPRVRYPKVFDFRSPGRIELASMHQA